MKPLAPHVRPRVGQSIGNNCVSENSRGFLPSRMYFVILVRFVAFALQDVKMDACEELSAFTIFWVHVYHFARLSRAQSVIQSDRRFEGESCLDCACRRGDVDFRRSRLPYPQTRQARDQLPRSIFSGRFFRWRFGIFPILPKPFASRLVRVIKVRS